MYILYVCVCVNEFSLAQLVIMSFWPQTLQTKQHASTLAFLGAFWPVVVRICMLQCIQLILVWAQFDATANWTFSHVETISPQCAHAGVVNPIAIHCIPCHRHKSLFRSNTTNQWLMIWVAGMHHRDVNTCNMRFHFNEWNLCSNSIISIIIWYYWRKNHPKKAKRVQMTKQNIKWEKTHEWVNT